MTINQTQTDLVDTNEVEKTDLDVTKAISSKKRKKTTILIITTLIIILLLGLSYLIISNKINFSSKTNTKSDSNSISELSFKNNYSFADYKLDNTPFTPNIPNYEISYSDLSNLSNFESSQNVKFTDTQKNALNLDNFFITINLDKFYGDNPDEPSMRSDDWTYLYEKIGGSYRVYDRKPENSVFISTDFLLHVYHRLLEKEFEYIEQEEFYPKLMEITDTLLDQAILSYSEAKDPKNKSSYERLIAYFTVPKTILDASYKETSDELTYTQPMEKEADLDTKENILAKLDTLKSRIPTSSYEMAKEEINLILDKEKIVSSPIFGDILQKDEISIKHDYTQYSPRSHYNKNSVLRSYFRSMIWYGRSNFALESSELTRDAIYISLLLNQTNQIENWESIYIPTAFFVGKSDDLGIYEYLEVLKELNVLEVNEESISQVQKRLEKYEGPKIMSSVIYGNDVFEQTKEELQAKTKGFYFMGQRFTPDAFIFTTLTQGDEKPDPETGEKLPSSTTALMVMSTLGNKTAEPLVNDWINDNAQYSTNVLNNRLSTLKQEFGSYTQDVWTQNIYWGWLYTLNSLFTESMDKTGYPKFMSSESWNKKNLQTTLGSWTELKHDTLLYSKQSYAELGAGGPEGDIPPVPKGYVEPNIVFFDRLIALSQMTYEGLLNRQILNNEFQGRNEKFIESLKFFRNIAVKELQNEVISDDEFEQLRTEAGSLSYILNPLPNEQQIENNSRSALIADVHTDALNEQILYEATGIPNYIYVAVKDKNGTRLTKGLVFSYFEFTNPLGERLNDEYWKEINYTKDKSKLPSAPTWATSLIK